MAWPFSHVVAPNLSSGLVELPASSTLVTNVPATSTPLWLMGISLNNTTAGRSVEGLDCWSLITTPPLR